MIIIDNLYLTFQGEYAYFDIERWRIGIMDDFLFEYKYLHGKPSW